MDVEIFGKGLLELRDIGDVERILARVALRSARLDGVTRSLRTGRGPLSRAVRDAGKALTSQRVRSALYHPAVRRATYGKPPPPDIKDDLAGLGLTPEKFLKPVGLKNPAGEQGRMLIEQISTRPTAEVNGIIGGYTGEGAKTVIPGQASAKVSFRQLCPDHKSPITYKRWCSEGDHEVAYGEILKGYEVGKDRYVIIEDKDLDNLPLATAHSIDITEFVPADDIEPGLYFKNAYYMEPEELGKKPYQLLRKALEATTAQLATERATASQILVLHSILQRQREANAAKDRDAFHQADEMFHATIAEIAGYPGIWTLIQQVKVHVDRYRRLTLPQAGRIGRVIVEHEAVLAAIEGHDPPAARNAMEFHLESLRDNISATENVNPEFFDKRS